MSNKLKITTSTMYSHYAFFKKADKELSSIDMNSVTITPTFTQNTVWIDPSAFQQNTSVKMNDEILLVQNWCNQNCEGPWMISTNKVDTSHCCANNNESPVSGVNYGPSVANAPDAGYLIMFKEESDYTKFLLYWS